MSSTNHKYILFKLRKVKRVRKQLSNTRRAISISESADSKICCGKSRCRERGGSSALIANKIEGKRSWSDARVTKHVWDIKIKIQPVDAGKNGRRCTTALKLSPKFKFGTILFVLVLITVISPVKL